MTTPAIDPVAQPERTGHRVALFGLGTVGTAVAARPARPGLARGRGRAGAAVPRWWA